MQCEIIVVGDSVEKTKRVALTIVDYDDEKRGQHHVMCNGQVFTLNIIKTKETTLPLVDIWELTTRLKHHDIIGPDATILSSGYTTVNLALSVGKNKFKEYTPDRNLTLEDLEA